MNSKTSVIFYLSSFLFSLIVLAACQQSTLPETQSEPQPHPACQEPPQEINLAVEAVESIRDRLNDSSLEPTDTNPKYPIRFVEPDPGIDYKILVIEPDPNVDYHIQIIDPTTRNIDWNLSSQLHDDLLERLREPKKEE